MEADDFQSIDTALWRLGVLVRFLHVSSVFRIHWLIAGDWEGLSRPKELRSANVFEKSEHSPLCYSWANGREVRQVS